MRWTNSVIGALALALGTAVSGCGRTTTESQATEPPAEHLALKEIGEMYRLYLKEHHRPPKKAADFTAYDLGYSYGILGLQGGDLIVLWGAQLAETPEAAKTVLAYEKLAPKQGGFVVMQDGSVEKMTAEEFLAAPKSGGG